MPTISFFARQDSTVASNSTLNPIGTNQAPTETLTFTDDLGGGLTGDLNFEYAAGGVDPDTRVIIGGTSYQFTVLLSGTLPVAGQQGASQLTGAAAALRGREVLLIRVVVGGETREYFFVLGEPPATLAQMNAIGAGAIPLNDVNLTPCLCEGTDVATPTGPRRVETLRAGDSITTEDGRVVTIAWVGRSVHDATRAWLDASLRPVRVPANALGPGLPERDLDLSPQHRIVFEGPLCELLFGEPRVLVAAKHLLGSIATSSEPDTDVAYYHILLDDHEILVANGLPVESFQPARRMVEAMTDDARRSLMGVLDVLGAEEMLTRPDALPTLRPHEVSVLLNVHRPAPMPLAAGVLAAARLH